MISLQIRASKCCSRQGPNVINLFFYRRSQYKVVTLSLLDLVQTQKSLNTYKTMNPYVTQIFANVQMLQQ